MVDYSDEKPPRPRPTLLHCLRILVGGSAVALVLGRSPVNLHAQGAVTADSAASLELVVTEVLETNPAVEAARLRWEAAQERPEIARALPDPMVTYGYFLQNVETRVGAMNQKITVSQKLPFPGKRALAASRAAKDALIAMWTYQTTAREIVLRTKLAYFDLYRIDRSREILEAQLELLTAMAATAQARYEAGSAHQQDVLKVRVASAELQNRLLALAQQRATALARVNALRNASPDRPLQPSRKLALPALPDRADAIAVGENYRQELRSAGVTIERDEVALALAQRERWPDFTVGLDYTQINDSTFSRPPDDGQDAVMGFVGVSIPIWFDKLGAQEREAEKRLAASRAARRSAANDVVADVTDAWFRAQVARDQVMLYERSLIPEAQQTFAVTSTAYETGESSLLDLLDSERALLSFLLGRVMSETDLAKALVSLERAVGVDLERIGTAGNERQNE